MKRIVVLLAVLAATPAYAKTHKDERWGFKVKVPSGWKQAAMSASEEWIAAKFLSKRELVSRPDQEGWTVSEHAQIWVIGAMAPSRFGGAINWICARIRISTRFP